MIFINAVDLSAVYDGGADAYAHAGDNADVGAGDNADADALAIERQSAQA